MRRTPILFAVMAIALLWSVVPAHAQDIYGLSFRPGETLSETAPRGTVDIVAGEGDTYKVTVDLTAAQKVLKLTSYPGATAFVVWGVDMDGQRHNLGVLDDALGLADAEADFLVAKVFLTAEADAEAEQPTGDRLYEVTLRNVAEVETTAAQKPKAEAKPAQAQAATATSMPAGAQAAPTAEAKASPAAATKPAEPKPSNLPTTGGQARDLFVLLVVALGLGLGALRLRTIRV